MKTIIKELGSEKMLVITDDMMDNENFITLYIEDSSSVVGEIDVLTEELLRAIQSYEKK